MNKSIVSAISFGLLNEYISKLSGSAGSSLVHKSKKLNYNRFKNSNKTNGPRLGLRSKSDSQGIV
ncbi:MAG: hypothetical protein ACOCZ5_00855 [bacterium]